MSVIGWLLDVFHARKWLVELIMLAVLVGAGALYREHLIAYGRQQQRDQDAAELARQVIEDRKKADIAEHQHDEELISLRALRDARPLHGGLCKPAALPPARAGVEGSTGATAATGDIQPVPQGDSGSGGQQDPDVRGMLDVLAGKADRLSASLREYQAR